ncbi:MAG: hypothetical protein K2H70_03635, partial [Bacteroidales bacterium]|nr:hypothetical protein [Bacteroidales bacterium]
MAQHHEGPDCDTIPIKLPFHDTVIQAGQTLVVDATDKQLQGFEIVWQKWSLYAGKKIIGNTISITQAGTYSFYARNYRDNGCPDRAGDTLYVRAVGCDTTPIKHPFHDTTVYAGCECLLVNIWDTVQHALWFLPDVFGWPETGLSMNYDFVVGSMLTPSPDSLDIYASSIFESHRMKIPYAGTFIYSIESNKPECPEREGDTIHISFVMRCDTTAVKLPFHDTAFCPGDSLLLVTSPWANRDSFLPVEAPSRRPSNFRTIWINLSSAAEVIYEGDSLFVTEPGRYRFYFANMVDNGCPDREGDTVGVAFWPKPQAFLPQ